MVFAAGFGTRMKPLTDTRPKPLINVGGTTLLDYTLSLVEAVEPKQVVVNAHYLAHQIKAHLTGHGVKLSVETPEILGMGGGLRNALPMLGEGPVWTSNSDAIWRGPNPLRFALEHWTPEKMDALLVCAPIDRTVGRLGGGDFTLAPDGQLFRGGDYVYGGVQIIKTPRLHEIAEDVFRMNTLWDMFAKEGRLFGCEYPGQWADVGRPEGIATAEQLMDV